VSSQIDVQPLGDGRFQIIDDGRLRLAYAVTRGEQTWMFIDGVVHVATTERGGRRGKSGHDERTALTSPMPASVASVSVVPGQQVARGDVLLMLEAMKMELPIKAPRDGTVKTVSCKAGDLVQPGVPLVELE
jgi:biotin carboxyl carrier protein